MRRSRVAVCVVSAAVLGVAAATLSVRGSASASAPSATGFVAIARSYLQARATVLVMDNGSGLAVSSLATVPMASMLQTETARDVSVLATRRQADHAGGVDYVRAVVELTNPAASTASDGTTTLRATDDTRLYFKPIPGAPPYEEWSVSRTFTFTHGT